MSGDRAGGGVGDDKPQLAAGATFDRGAGLDLDVGVGEPQGAKSGRELVVGAPGGPSGDGVVAEHDAQGEPVAALDDLELANVGVCGEPGELDRVHGHAAHREDVVMRPCTVLRRFSVRPQGQGSGSTVTASGIS